MAGKVPVCPTIPVPRERPNDMPRGERHNAPVEVSQVGILDTNHLSKLQTSEIPSENKLFHGYRKFLVDPRHEMFITFQQV